MFETLLVACPDIDRQHTLLNEVSRLVDEGVLRTKMTERFAPLKAANRKRVHKLVETGTTRGKYVLEGFR